MPSDGLGNISPNKINLMGITYTINSIYCYREDSSSTYHLFIDTTPKINFNYKIYVDNQLIGINYVNQSDSLYGHSWSDIFGSFDEDASPQEYSLKFEKA